MRGAWPLVGPEVPECFPADAWAPLTRRHEEGNPVPEGSGRADGCRRAARRRLLPMPVRFATDTGYGRHGRRRFCRWGVRRREAGHRRVEERAIHCDALGHRRLGNALGRRLGWFCRRSLCRWPRGGTGCGYCGRGQAFAVGGPGACVVAAGPRSRAAQPERPRRGSLPPRGSTAMCWASIVSFLALPPWMRLPWRGHDRGRKAVYSPEVSQPVPGQHACDGQGDLSAGGGDGLEALRG